MLHISQGILVGEAEHASGGIRQKQQVVQKLFRCFHDLIQGLTSEEDDKGQNGRYPEEAEGNSTPSRAARYLFFSFPEK